MILRNSQVVGYVVGDPEDRTMRVVERTILIPNQMKKKANATTCKEANESKFPVIIMPQTGKCSPR